MAARIFAASLATTASAGSIALSISDCGSGVSGHVTDINPKSITTGQTNHVVGSGTLDSDVSGGSFTLDIKALGVSLQSCNGDICSASSCPLPLKTGSIAFNGLACPVSAGSVEIPMDVTVSSAIPSQIAILEITLAVDGVLCAKINTKAGGSLEANSQAEGGKDLLNFALGVVEGMLSESTPNLRNCVSDVMGAGKKAVEVVEDIKKLLQPPHDSFADLTAAVQELVHLIQDVMPSCGATKDDIQNLLAALKQIKNLKDLIAKMEQHIVSDFEDIMTELKAAKSNWDEKNFEEAGRSLGLALHTLTVDDSVSPSMPTEVPMPTGEPAEEPMPSQEPTNEYTEHAGTNCYQGAGATGIDVDLLPDVASMDGCIAACDATPECEGFVFSAPQTPPACWRRSGLDLSQCVADEDWNLWVKPSTPAVVV